MKIKILESSGWYKHFVGSEFEICNYDINNNLRFAVTNHGWVFNHHCVITELPESFCVKRCDDEEKWKKYIDWLNKTCKNDFGGYGVSPYYGSLEGGGWYAHTLFGTEIHIDDMIKHIDYMKTKDSITVIYKNGTFFEVKEEVNMETQKLSRIGLEEIHSVACTSWKKTLVDWAKNRNIFKEYIELSQEEVNKMFNACTKDQLPIVSKYLKQDDGSIDVTKFNISGKGFCDNNHYIIRDREIGKYKRKSFLLSSKYNWEIKEDEIGELCLIPTKKK